MDEQKTVFLLGASSDIGLALAKRLVAAGCRVVGTYRNPSAVADWIGRPGFDFLPCDAASAESIRTAAARYAALGLPWDVFISAVGSQQPIGPYFSCDADAWERSLRVNATGQLRALHALYPCRRPGLAHVAFLAGGGTNGPFPNYSAYCASKILLIKMCELLDAENEDLNVFILGPGWVRTKIHEQTLANPAGAGGNYQRTLAFLRSSDPGTSHDDIYRALVWCIEQGKAVAGGRNFSVVHDPWRRPGGGLADWLRGDPHRFRLRRHGNDALPRS